jgi:structure-specific recognition protein 1
MFISISSIISFSILKISPCSITLGTVQTPGQFKVNSGGLTWNRQGGGKTIKIDKADIASVKWMKVPKTNQLEFRTKDGLVYKFVGFREQVIISLSLFPFLYKTSNEPV